MSWRKVDRLPIQNTLSDLLRQTIQLTKAQIELEKRKLERLKYGS